jgi:ribosomal 30S subunit maturation factor RimM
MTYFRTSLLLLLLGSAPAAAQDLPDLSSASSDAVSALKKAAENKLLIADLIGADVKEPSGRVVGTIKNLVAIPGGRIVAALIKPSDSSDLLPVPFQALKVAKASETASATLPDTMKNLRNSSAVKDLSSALGSVLSDDG